MKKLDEVQAKHFSQEEADKLVNTLVLKLSGLVDKKLESIGIPLRLGIDVHMSVLCNWAANFTISAALVNAQGINHSQAKKRVNEISEQFARAYQHECLRVLDSIYKKENVVQ